jgi:peptidoglycan hydrolase CwlO-like protein
METQGTQVAFDMMEIIPFLATAGGVFATYLAGAKFIKNWIIQDCLTKEQADKLKHSIKQSMKEDLEKEVTQLQKDIEKNTVWLRDLDHKADRAMIEMSGLQEAINGIRERLREAH